MQENGKLWILFILDLIVMVCSYYYFYRYYNNSLFISSKAFSIMGIIILVWVIITVNSNLCNLSINAKLFDLILTTIKAYSFLSALLITIIAIFGNFKPNANIVLYPLLISFCVSLIIRCVFFCVRKHFITHGYMQKTVLVIGGDRIAERVINKINSEPELGYRLHGVLADYYHETMHKGLYLGKINRINEILESNSLNEVLIALPLRREKEILTVVETCELEGIRFRIIPDFFRMIEKRAVLDYLNDIPLISIRSEPLIFFQNRVIKRTFDILFSFGVILLLSPLFIILSIAIKLGSPGPVFFKQKRVGANNKEFDMYKFRTMKAQETKESDIAWTTENDSRVTPIGKFLRKHNIDELPQFWNVFIGDMSVVGPRPERKFFVDQFKKEVPRYKVRHQVKSGITGWAQVNGLRGDTSIKDTIEHDLFYIENWSFWWDNVVIWKTLFGSKTNINAY